MIRPALVLCLLCPATALAQWSPSIAKADAEGRLKRRPVLILVWAKGDAASDRLEKDFWSVEPNKTRIRDFTCVKMEKAALADPKTWAGVPRWKAQGEGDAAVPEIRIIHPWGKELKRIALKDLVPAELAQQLKSVFDEWEAQQGPIREDVRALDNALKGQDKDLMIACVKRVCAHHEPWTLPMVAACLYQPGVKIREAVIPELRRIEPEDGLWALVKWLDDQATTAGCDMGWQEVARANDIRTLPMIKDGILNNNVSAVTRIRAIAQFREKASIPFLIELFPKVGSPPPKPGETTPPPNPIHDEIASSLQKLTGKDFGKDHQKWKNWWKSQGPVFEFPE